MRYYSDSNTSIYHNHSVSRNDDKHNIQRRQWWQPIANMTGKKISLFFFALNLLGLFQYRNVMRRVLHETTMQNEDFAGSYPYHHRLINDTKIENSSGIEEPQSPISAPASAIEGHDIQLNTTILPDIVSQQEQEQEQHKQQQQNTTISSTLPLSSNKVDNRGKFAYAFLIGGAMTEKKGSAYLGGLYGVVVAVHSLRRQGSKADFVVMIQISATTNETKLPELEESVLKAMNIHVKYLPKYSDPKFECFYSLMMEKFRILQFEEYSRVLYLDADILPKSNLDYVMELSEQDDMFRENVVLSYKQEPATGGFFVLKPNASDYEELVDIVRNIEHKYLQIPYPHWDNSEGWGHVIDESDPWKSTKTKRGTKWNFYGSQADQGFLYYWTKYYKKSVSIINLVDIQHWGLESGTNSLQLLRHDNDTLREYMCTNSECDSSAWKMAPYQNFVHLTGRSKPWYKNRTSLEEGINSKKNHTSFKRYSNEEYWYWLLKNALQETGFHDRVSLDFITQEKRESAVGSTPSFDQRAQYIRRKAKNGWRQYEYEERDFNEGNYDERLLTLANSGRETGRRAQDLVASLESFQPQTALRPYLIRLEAIKNNLMTQAMPQISPGEEETALDSTSANEAADTRKWAYAFLLGGARSNTTETEYLGGFYSVVVAVYQLRKLGSRADFVLMVQIAAESPHHKLSGFEQDILQKMNIKVIYIPKFANGKLECFYSLMMEKFRILNLTEYSRVMYLDYDVLPTCNLDYLFDLSDPLPRLPGRGSNMMDQTSDATFRLKENVILAYQSEPSAGGIFILKPDASDFNQIQRIIYEKEVRSSKQPYPHWDPMFGWGHVITKPDSWKDMRGRTGSNWTWYGAEADQGLLYYWTKYVKKSVSIISKHNIEQWDSNYWDTDSKGTLFLRQNETNMPQIAKKPLENYGCPVEGFLPAPYNDFFHLTGRAKPWFLEREQLENPDCFNNNNERECKMQAKWYRLLNEAMVSIKIPDGFSLDFLGTKKLAPVGHAPNDKQISEYLAVKKNRHWNQYEDLKIEQ